MCVFVRVCVCVLSGMRGVCCMCVDAGGGMVNLLYMEVKY